MRKTPIIIVLLLSCVWWYVSWYWYTCKIKGICLVEKVEIHIPQDKNNVRIQDTDTQSTKDTQSEDLVSIPNEPTDTSEENIVPDTVPEGQPQEQIVEPDICEDIITLPIWLGADNDTEQVKRLEKFLNTFQDESLEENGIYETSDYEAVKRLQADYKKDILDPWGITTPTGYVWKTTIKKIHEIHCSQ